MAVTAIVGGSNDEYFLKQYTSLARDLHEQELYEIIRARWNDGICLAFVAVKDEAVRSSHY